ncbi:ankyrin [Naviculisporaceae sp. PSN 640]
MSSDLAKQPAPAEEAMPSSNPYASTSTSAINGTTDTPSSSTTPSAETTEPEPEPQPEPLPNYHLGMHNQESDSVPLYTETAPETLSETLDSLRKRAQALGPENITLPITKFDPLPFGSHNFSGTFPNWSLPHQIINAFFRAILSKNDELVTLFVQQGLISPDCPNARGETPLIVAVTSGSGQMVCTLVNLGADVNLLGRYDPSRVVSTGDLTHIETALSAWRLHHENTHHVNRLPLRTPLMVAASRGNLALVKLLMQDFKADDSIIAPDGQLALRLAVESSPDGPHKEIVEFLPARRGGAWRRWKTHHEVAVRRIKRAGHNLFEFVKFFVWTIPRFFVWSCPKHLLVLPVKEASVWAWENKHKFGGWCKRQVKAVPGRMKRGAEKIGRGVKAVGKGVAKIPGLVWRLIKWVGRVIKSIPGFMKIIGSWVWDCLKKIGIALGGAFLKVVSAIHTAVMAVLDFFRRITLKDVWNGVCAVFRAIFVDLPKAIWSGLKGFAGVSYAGLKKLFGWVGQVIWYSFLGLGWLLLFIPKQLWKILVAIGSSIAKGYYEIMVWFNPKH